MRIKVLLSLLFFAALVVPQYAQSEPDELTVLKGRLDFSGRGITGSEITKLDGEWEFYWNDFLSSETIRRENTEPSDYIPVPGSWHLSTDHPVHGYGTLRLVLSGLDTSVIYSLYVPEMISSYRLWINGQEMGGNGIIGRNRDESVPVFLPKVYSFSAQGGEAEVIIHVSNYDYRKSGIWRSLYVGRQDGIFFLREKRLIMEIAIAAVLFSIALFHIAIYASRNQEKAEFLFGLICLTFVIRILCTGEQVLSYFIPSLPWGLLRKLEYIPFYGSAPLLALFMSTLFPEEAVKIFNRSLIAVCLILGSLMWILPVRTGNYLIPLAEILMIIGLFYAVYILARAIRRKREEAILLLIAYVLFFLAVINDILYASQIIQSIYTSPLGFVVFMMMQSQMLIIRYSRSFTQRELLTKSRDKFRQASITDGLTGLYNVRYLHRTLEDEIEDSEQRGKPLSIIMADVDNFKLFNDTWGHKQGDEVLKIMGDIFRGSAREKDSPCRYGGEEFSLILPETTLEEAMDVSERIRLRFEEAGGSDERMYGITVSIGVAQYRAPEDPDTLIDRADKALYKAKDLGKNRVVRAL